MSATSANREKRQRETCSVSDEMDIQVCIKYVENLEYSYVLIVNIVDFIKRLKLYMLPDIYFVK
jgi:hypothetical protein